MRYSKDFLDRIKTHAQIPNTLMPLLDEFKRNGSADCYIAHVPWRKDLHASLHVFKLNQIWWFKDMAYPDDKGDVIELAQRLQSLDFMAAVSWLATQLGIPLSEDHRPESTAKLVPAAQRLKALQRLYELASPLEDETAAARYLSNRGLCKAARELDVRCFEGGQPQAILQPAEQ